MPVNLSLFKALEMLRKLQRREANPFLVCMQPRHGFLSLTILPVLSALLGEHEKLMFDLLNQIEKTRNNVEVSAFEEDLSDPEIDPDQVVKEM
jgi:hypothetical protein